MGHTDAACADRLDRGSQQTPRWRRESRANPSLNPKFPASWENTGNFIDLDLGDASTVAKNAVQTVRYEQIPYAPQQGIFRRLTGN
jgi:hypothetical protein